MKMAIFFTIFAWIFYLTQGNSVVSGTMLISSGISMVMFSIKELRDERK